jgi:hypothetical protein
LRQELKAAIGLLMTALAVVTKSSAYLGGSPAVIFNNSVVSIGLLLLMALGLFIFAYYSIPEQTSQNDMAQIPQPSTTQPPTTQPSDTL